MKDYALRFLRYFTRKNHNFLSLLLLLLTIGAGVRSRIFMVNHNPIGFGTGDDVQYDESGRNFKDWFLGKGRYNQSWGLAHRTPVYPLFIATIYRFFGENRVMVFYGQILLDVFTMMLMYLVGSKVFNNPFVILPVVWIVAVRDVDLLIGPGMLYSENLAMFLLIFSAYIFVLSVEKEKKYLWFTAGILFGLLTLCRPIFQLLPFFLLFSTTLFLAVFLKRRVSHLLGLSIFLLLGYIVPMVPWTIRNYVLLKAFVPISTFGGQQLLYAHQRIEKDDYCGYVDYVGYGEVYQIVLETNEGLLVSGSEVVMDKILKKETFNLIRRYPYRYFAMCLNRFNRLWFARGYGSAYEPSIPPKRILLCVLSLGSIIFCVLLKNWYVLVIYAILAYNTVVHMAITAVGRYNYPMLPFVYLLSTYSIFAVLSLLIKTLKGNRVLLQAKPG